MPAKQKLLLAMFSSLALAGCGAGTKQTASEHGRNPELVGLLHTAATRALMRQASAHKGRVHINVVERASGFMNAGSPNGFALIVPSETAVTVVPDSSAHITARFTEHPFFASSLARRRWEAARKPKLPPMRLARRSVTTPAGSYSFIPIGTKLTFQEVKRLPTSPSSVTRAIEAHLLRFSLQDRRAVLLRSFGYLLAAAPLRSQTRAAMFEAIVSLPGVWPNGTGSDALGRRGTWIVMDSPATWVELLLDPAHATVLAVQERVRKPQPIFPSLSVGDPIEMTTFVSDS